jgi:predicted dehydrogenase
MGAASQLVRRATPALSEGERVNSLIPAANPVRRVVIDGLGGGQGGLFGTIVHQSSRVQLVGAVEGYAPNVDRARERAALFGVENCPVFSNLEQAIAETEFDLGILATLPQYHEAGMIALLEAGKWAHCEKPPTLDLPGARRVAWVEARSPGWVTLNFHLDRQTALLEANVARGEIGPPRLITTRWLRSLLSPDEEEAQRLGGLRRGQPVANPMDDLCHVLRASLKFFPPGARITRVVGHSWGNLETIVATVRFQFHGTEEKAQIIATTGWDLPVPGLVNHDRAQIVVQGAGGAAWMNFLLDNRFQVGDQIPEEYLARLRRIEMDGKIVSGTVGTPQPRTPFECMRAKLHDAVDLIDRGQRPAEPMDGGLKVMALLDALRRSEQENREVAVESDEIDR